MKPCLHILLLTYIFIMPLQIQAQSRELSIDNISLRLGMSKAAVLDKLSEYQLQNWRGEPYWATQEEDKNFVFVKSSDGKESYGSIKFTKNKLSSIAGDRYDLTSLESGGVYEFAKTLFLLLDDATKEGKGTPSVYIQTSSDNALKGTRDAVFFTIGGKTVTVFLRKHEFEDAQQRPYMTYSVSIDESIFQVK